MWVVTGFIELRIAAIGLICLGSGIALCLYTLRLWKEARPESPALAPLEVMSDERFITGDDRTRRDLLAMAREIVSGTPHQPKAERRRPVRPEERRAPVRRSPAPQSEDRLRRSPIDPLLK